MRRSACSGLVAVLLLLAFAASASAYQARTHVEGWGPYPTYDDHLSFNPTSGAIVYWGSAIYPEDVTGFSVQKPMISYYVGKTQKVLDFTPPITAIKHAEALRRVTFRTSLKLTPSQLASVRRLSAKHDLLISGFSGVSMYMEMPLRF